MLLVYSLDNSTDSRNDRHAYGIACHFIQPAVAQSRGLGFIELFVGKALQSPAFSRRELSHSAVAENAVSVLHRQREHRLVRLFYPTALLTDGFLVGRYYGSRLILNKHGGVFAFVLADATVLSGSNAPSRFGKLRIGVHVDKKIALRIAGRYGMSDLFSDPASPCIHCRVGKVDAVAGMCELKAGFRIYLDRQGYIVESGFSSESSGAACESNADSLVRVDPIALCASKELDKRRCICVCER